MLVKIEHIKAEGGNYNSLEYDERLYFHTEDEEMYIMYHSQECSENVLIEDIEGDLNDLIGNPIIMVEKVSKEDENICGTWTFYKFATIKGFVTIRWMGESNGYYSEEVDFAKVEKVIDDSAEVILEKKTYSG